MNTDQNQDFFEFEGPDYATNGYGRAKYRVSLATVKLVGDKEYLLRGKTSTTVEVPSGLEILAGKEWRQHPVVFRHQPDRKGEGHHLVIFLPDGTYYSSYKRPFEADGRLYKGAEVKGLTAGRVGGG